MEGWTRKFSLLEIHKHNLINCCLDFGDDQTLGRIVEDLASSFSFCGRRKRDGREEERRGELESILPLRLLRLGEWEAHTRKLRHVERSVSKIGRREEEKCPWRRKWLEGRDRRREGGGEIESSADGRWELGRRPRSANSFCRAFFFISKIWYRGA